MIYSSGLEIGVRDETLLLRGGRCGWGEKGNEANQGGKGAIHRCLLVTSPVEGTSPD